MRRALIVGLACMAVSRLAAAQTVDSSRVTAGTRRVGVFPGFGIHFGEPQKLSAAVGLVVREEWQSARRDHSRAAALLVEPGLAAGRAALDWVEGFGTLGSGFAVGPSVLRSWDDPWVARPNTTYAGGELMVWPIFHAGPRVGIYHVVGSDAPGKRWLVSADVGIGM